MSTKKGAKMMTALTWGAKTWPPTVLNKRQSFLSNLIGLDCPMAEESKCSVRLRDPHGVPDPFIS